MARPVLHVCDRTTAPGASAGGNRRRHSGAPRRAVRPAGSGVLEEMPRHYIDEEWDRDALFACRNLVGLEFAAEQMKVSMHALEKTASRAHGPLLVWIFGGGG